LERAGVEGIGEGEMEEEESGSNESPLKIVLWRCGSATAVS